MKKDDSLRPRTEPARTLYDAYEKEAERRHGRGAQKSVLAEREAVWSAAIDYANRRSLRAPSKTEVSKAEVLARGHTDYAAQWARNVAVKMTPLATYPGVASAVDICDWFDVSNEEHLDAYRHLQRSGAWPEGFLPENVTQSPFWHMEILSKLANAYLNDVVLSSRGVAE